MLPYFERWMRRFPDCRTLAAAAEQEVMALWQGLGYYSRARNLHGAAKAVIECRGGVPARTGGDPARCRAWDVIRRAQLRRLRMTSRRRWWTRISRGCWRGCFAVREPIDGAAGLARVWELRGGAPAARSEGRAFNAGLMEIGRADLHAARAAMRGVSRWRSFAPLGGRGCRRNCR